MAQNGAERRKCFRHPCSIPLRFYLEGTPDAVYDGMALNLSTGGALLRISDDDVIDVWPHLEPLQTRLVITELLLYDKLTEIKCIVDVRWRRSEQGTDNFLIGLSFAEKNDQRTKIICEFIGKL